ncbi:platelet glycoprotein Ib alpha chain-like [Sphaeramia orbicularis]|uniref:Platelet glycoprotein Ib alpha chain-like n=1 Tax=Sphaeramia orbicularis TaxID=375764 RepID=A0A673BBA4_9TELE|nr:platelet glycoprotein Ib alpha chain-like [Sphaeramia orbicularis]
MHLFVIILLYCAATVMAVPGCLSDRDKDHRLRRNCSGADFSEVPAGFEPKTQVLLFPNNIFSSLSWSSFKVFTNIYEIDLTSNKVPEVTPSAIPILPSLRVLRLGRNHLTTLSDGSFSACPALAELYLHDNAIRSLSDNSFSGLSKLEILDLSSNYILALPELMLHPLVTIETLYLESNKITVMPNDWFSKKEEVPYLYLSSNPWACSCSLDYLRRYLDNYEFNIYVRDGLIIRSDAESVVCDSPNRLQGQFVISLEESDLCSSQPDSGPRGDNEPVVTTTTLTAPPSSTTSTTPPPTTTPTTPPPTITSTTSKPMTPLTPVTITSNPTVTSPASSVTTPLIIELTTDLPDSGTTTTLQSLVAKTPTPSTQVMVLNPPTEVTTPITTSSVNNNITQFKWQSKVATARAAGVFCVWLFAGNLLLCVMSAACSVMTVVRLFLLYRGAYKILKRRTAGGKERLRLITCTRREEKEGGGGSEGVLALYRSVLFISKDGREGVERGNEEEGGKRGEVGRERLTLESKGEEEGGGAVMRQEGVEREERRVYKKTLYRLISKQEEIEGWREVMEECQCSPGDGVKIGEQGGGGGGGVSRKRYSVILREEREVASGDKEELDWVVGGWEVKKSGEGRDEEPRSSWGEWLAHCLPSMPWGVTIPPEVEADQRCHQLAK